MASDLEFLSPAAVSPLVLDYLTAATEFLSEIGIQETWDAQVKVMQPSDTLLLLAVRTASRKLAEAVQAASLPLEVDFLGRQCRLAS